MKNIMTLINKRDERELLSFTVFRVSKGLLVCISPVRPNTYTIDATLQLGPRWEFKYDIKIPGNDDIPNDKRTSVKGANILESDITTSTEEEQLVDFAKVQKFGTWKKPTGYENGQNGNRVRLCSSSSEDNNAYGNKYIERGLNYDKHIQEDSSDKSENYDFPRGFTRPVLENQQSHKKHSHHKVTHGFRLGEALDDDRNKNYDDGNSENNNFPAGFTRPIIDSQEKHNKHKKHSKHKKKSGFTFGTDIFWPQKTEKRKKHKTSSTADVESREKDYFIQSQNRIHNANELNSKPQQWFNKTNNSALIKWQKKIKESKQNIIKAVDIENQQDKRNIKENEEQGPKTNHLNENTPTESTVGTFANGVRNVVKKNSSNEHNIKDLNENLQIKTGLKTPNLVNPDSKFNTQIVDKGMQQNSKQTNTDTRIRHSATKKKLKNKSESLKMLQNLEKVKNETQMVFKNLYRELNRETQKIKDNETISSFTKHILRRTLNLFDIMEEKSTEYRWKKKMKHLARSYEDKFNEFLRNSKHHKIRTPLGTKKVILNAIDVSNRIVDRLINFMADDMEKNGFMYNTLTPILFREELSKEENHELKRACDKLNVCSTERKFSRFISDVLVMMLSVEKDKFVPAFDALTKAARKTDFDLGSNIHNGIKKKLDYCARQDVHVQRGMIMILKNVLANRNSPLVLYADSAPTDKMLRSTLAFQEIINTLDEKVPKAKYDQSDWENVKQELEKWINGVPKDVEKIMSEFVTTIGNHIKIIDDGSFNIVSRNAEILLN